MKENTGNQRKKFGQLIEYNKRNFHAQNKLSRLVQDLFLFFETTLYEVKAGRLQLSLNIF